MGRLTALCTVWLARPTRLLPPSLRSGQWMSEFGNPDWELTRYFVLFGSPENHASNLYTVGLKALKKNRAKIVAVRPVRIASGAIADEWIGIKPGTEGLFAASHSRALTNAKGRYPPYCSTYKCALACCSGCWRRRSWSVRTQRDWHSSGLRSEIGRRRSR